MTLQQLLYEEEYKANGYKAMWENQREKGDMILSISQYAKMIAYMSQEMEWIRDGHPTHDASKLSAEEFAVASKVAELCLIVTEIDEAIQAIVAGEDPDEEYADINIRSSNAMTRNTGSDMERVIRRKHEKNLTRGKLHGRHV